MKPQTIGRVLGIGVRVAGRMAGQRLAGEAAREPATSGISSQVSNSGRGGAPAAVATQADGRDAGRVAGRATGSLARGVGGFLRPFRRIGNILFLEVVGVFFFVFVLVFGSTAWRARLSYMQGPDHQKFLVSAALMLLFLYLSVSSFWRARRK